MPVTTATAANHTLYIGSVEREILKITVEETNPAFRSRRAKMWYKSTLFALVFYRFLAEKIVEPGLCSHVLKTGPAN